MWEGPYGDHGVYEDGANEGTQRWISAGDVAPALIDALVDGELVERHPDTSEVLVRKNPAYQLPWDGELDTLGSSREHRLFAGGLMAE